MTPNIARRSIHRAAVPLVFIALGVIVACGGNSDAPSTPGSSDSESQVLEGIEVQELGDTIASSSTVVAPGEKDTVSLPSGAVLELGKSENPLENEIELIQSAPPVWYEGPELLTDVYYATSSTRPRPGAVNTLRIPISDIPASEVTLLAISESGAVYPVDGTINPTAGYAEVDLPKIFVPDAPEGALTFPSAPGAGPLAFRDFDTVYKTGIAAARAAATNLPPRRCRTGAPGEIHEEPGHSFRIHIRQQTTCALVDFVTDTLEEALASHNREYAYDDGTAALHYYGPQPMRKMDIYIEAPAPQADVNAQYYFLSWSGYMYVDGRIATIGNVLREDLFHELFHAVQDSYSNMFFAGQAPLPGTGGVGPGWWYEATAKWAGSRAGNLTPDQLAARDALLPTHGLATPVDQSLIATGIPLFRTVNRDTAYQYSLLVGFVERLSAQYLKDTLNSWSTVSSQLYNGLVSAGNLKSTYAEFVRETAAADRGTLDRLWRTGWIQERDTATRVIRRPTEVVADAGVDRTELTDSKDREAAHLFHANYGHMTARFFHVSNNSTSDLSFEAFVWNGSSATTNGWIFPDAAASPAIRISPSGTKFTGLAPGQDATIVVFNSNVDSSETLSLSVRFLKDDTPPPAPETPKFKFLSVTTHTVSSRDHINGEVENISGEVLHLRNIHATPNVIVNLGRTSSTSTVQSLAPGDITAFTWGLSDATPWSSFTNNIDEVVFNDFVLTHGPAEPETRTRHVNALEFENTIMTALDYSPDFPIELDQYAVRGELVNKTGAVVPAPFIAVTYYNAAGEVIGVDRVVWAARRGGFKPGGRIEFVSDLPFGVVDTPVSYRVSAYAESDTEAWITYKTGAMQLPNLVVELHTVKDNDRPLCSTGCLYGVVRNEGPTAVDGVSVQALASGVEGIVTNPVETYIPPGKAVPFSIVMNSSLALNLSLSTKVIARGSITFDDPPKIFTTVGPIFFSEYEVDILGGGTEKRYQLNTTVQNISQNTVRVLMNVIVIEGAKVVSLGRRGVPGQLAAGESVKLEVRGFLEEHSIVNLREIGQVCRDCPRETADDPYVPF